MGRRSNGIPHKAQVVEGPEQAEDGFFRAFVDVKPGQADPGPPRCARKSLKPEGEAAHHLLFHGLSVWQKIADRNKARPRCLDKPVDFSEIVNILLHDDKGDADLVNTVSKSLEASIKKFAKDIRDKYIDPPYTTDFGIMFLPVEGLYAEVVRRTSLIETLQRDYKIVITGPTTLAAILNSL